MDIIDIEEQFISQVAYVHQHAFQGYVNSQLGQGYIKSFINWFAKNDQSIALCAIDQEEICGYLVGAPIGYTNELNKAIFWNAFLGTVTHFWVFFKPKYFRVLMARLGLYGSPSSQIPDLPRPTMSLVGIGVLPSARGKGVGKNLIQTFENCALQQNMGSLRLSVYPDNTAARKLYESMGWEPCKDVVTPSGAIYYHKIISADNVSE